ncbi:MAG: tandem-95 repeat protein [Rhodothermales bacterium]|nr:tandem-95 repeat protein [Rhodothermales bacterium]MBO6781320.1 tandem-95 repeat protein [Rhodothermales bacterium]
MKHLITLVAFFGLVSTAAGQVPALYSVDSGTSQIYQLNPWDGSVIGSPIATPVPTYTPGGGPGPEGLAFDGVYLYFVSGNVSETGGPYTAVDNRTIHRINASTGVVDATKTLPAPAGTPGAMNHAIDALATDGTTLWAHRPYDNVVFEISLASFTSASTPPSFTVNVTSSLGGMGFNPYDGFLYLSEPASSKRVLRVHATGASKGNVHSSFDMPSDGILGIDFVHNKLFVNQPTEIVDVSPTSGTTALELNRFGGPGAMPLISALAGGPGSSWVCRTDVLYSVNSLRSSISVYDPNVGTILHEYLAPIATQPPGGSFGGPEGLAFDGTKLSYISGDHPSTPDVVYKVDPCTGAVLDAATPPWPSVPVTSPPTDPTIDALANGTLGGVDMLFALRPATNEIYHFDNATGSLVGTTTLTVNGIGGLGFSNARQTFFVSDFNASPNTVFEINPASGAPIATHTLPVGDVLGVDFVGNRPFISQNKSPGEIKEIDFAGTVLNSFFAEDDQPSALAGGPGTPPTAPTGTVGHAPLFSIDSDTDLIYELDPFNGFVIRSFPTPVPSHKPSGGGPDGLAYDGTTLYYTSGNASETGMGYTELTNRTIFYIDPNTGLVIDTMTLPPASGTGNLDQAIDALASDGTFLYANRPSDGVIFKINPASKIYSTITLTGVQKVGGMGFNTQDGYLYISDSSTNTIHMVDPSTGGTVGNWSTLPEDGVLGIDFVLSKMFLSLQSTQEIVDIVPSSGAPRLNKFPQPGSGFNAALAGPPGLPPTCDTDLLYSVDSESRTITAMNPNNGNIERRFLTPVTTHPPGTPSTLGGPEGLAFDGNALYYISGDDGLYPETIFTVDPCTGQVLDTIEPSFPAPGAGLDATIDALAYGDPGATPTLFALRPATNEVFHIDPATGAIMHTTTVAVNVIGGMGFSNTHQSLFISDWGSTPSLLHEVDPVSGAILNTMTMSGSDMLGVDFVDNRLFAATDNGSGLIEELDLVGTVLNSFPAPDVMPSALAGPPAAPPVLANVTFEVNTLPYQLAGLFDPAADEVHVVGPFNGWACLDPSCIMTGVGDGDYEATLEIPGFPGQDVPYKFFINLDPVRFGAAPPPVWEEPHDTGGANRFFQYSGIDMDVGKESFNDLTAANIIPAGTQIDVTFNVDMDGAPGFDGTTDKVWVNLGLEPLFAISQGFTQDQRFELLPSATDPDLFEGVVTLQGPAPSGFLFKYAFGPDGTNPLGEEQGADFDDPGRRRVRWVAPTAAGWPTSVRLPMDEYTPTGPLPVEMNPAALTANDDSYSTPEDTPITLDVLANDIDPSGLGLEIDEVTDPGAGVTLSDAGNGRILFTPDANVNGAFSFRYTVEDAAGRTDQATVSVQVTPVNDAPRAVRDEAETNQGTPVSIPALANDTDLDGDNLAISSVEDPPNGSVSIGSGGDITYTPEPDFVGADRFTYTITDGEASARGSIVVTVNSVNQPPVTPDVDEVIDEDSSITLALLAGASDPDGDAISLTTVTTPANGTATDNDDGTVTYTPNANFSGTDTFQYTVADANGADATGTVTITIRPSNDPPVAVDDVRRAFEGSAAVYDVLANDSDPDGDALSITSVGAASKGTIARKRGGIEYTPNAGASGSETVSYTVGDGNGGRSTANLIITITPLPADNDGIDEAIEAAAPNNGDGNNDGVPDSQQANVASLPSAATGQYISVSSEPGSEVTGLTSTTQSPAPPSDPPPPEAEFPQGFLDFEIRGGIGNPTSVVRISLPEGHGITTYFKYGPEPDDDTPHWYEFTYDGETGAQIIGNELILHFKDGGRGDDDMLANGVIVDPGAPAKTPNNLPVAAPDQASIDEDESISINVLANDFDDDADTVTLIQFTQPDNGTVTLSGAELLYTPNENFFGQDTFEYIISDGRGGSTSGTVTVEVAAVNDIPVAVADFVTTDEDTPVRITDLLANDTDVEGDPISLDLVIAADKGLVARNVDGSVTYTPPAEFSGTDTFTYTVNDGQAQSAPGRVTVTINTVNDAPVAEADFGTIEVGETSVTVDVLSNDTDIDSQNLTVTDVSGAQFGTVSIQSDGTVVYVPGPAFQNLDSFTYTVSDDEGATSTGTVTIALGAAAPIAEDDEGTVAEDNPVVIQVLVNDTDPNGDALTVISVSDPPNGTATVDQDGNVVYTPDDDFFGTDSFTYEISDGGITTSATVTVTITPVNDAPRFDPDVSVFVFPLDGSQVFVGGEVFENPVDSGEVITIDFNEAVDVEGDALTYKWVLGSDEEVTTPVLQTDTDETELTVLVSEIAEVLDSAGASPGEGTTVYHRIIASDGELETESAVSTFTFVRGYITSVEDEALPEEFELQQNYPNPFNPVTRIRFGLPVSEHVHIEVFDALGRRVSTLVNDTMPAGWHDVTFEAVDLPSGVYLYLMKSGTYSESRSFVLLR